ncbi:MAG: M23 family metallopeptidase [Alphaproteobacteria bacterium]
MAGPESPTEFKDSQKKKNEVLGGLLDRQSLKQLMPSLPDSGGFSNADIAAHFKSGDYVSGLLGFVMRLVELFFKNQPAEDSKTEDKDKDKDKDKNNNNPNNPTSTSTKPANYLDAWSKDNASYKDNGFFDKTKITSPFGIRKGDLHKGPDFFLPGGKDADVKAFGDATVVFAGWQRESNKKLGWGQYAVLDYGKGFYTLSGHADKLLVKTGDKLKTGDVYMKQGATGDVEGVTGIHVHQEWIVNDGKGNFFNVDPTAIIEYNGKKEKIDPNKIMNDMEYRAVVIADAQKKLNNKAAISPGLASALTDHEKKKYNFSITTVAQTTTTTPQTSGKVVGSGLETASSKFQTQLAKSFAAGTADANDNRYALSVQKTGEKIIDGRRITFGEMVFRDKAGNVMNMIGADGKELEPPRPAIYKFSSGGVDGRGELTGLSNGNVSYDLQFAFTPLTKANGAMIDDAGVGFKMILTRNGKDELYRIHPDGSIVGTRGCIGIINPNETQAAVKADAASLQFENMIKGFQTKVEQGEITKNQLPNKLYTLTPFQTSIGPKIS